MRINKLSIVAGVIVAVVSTAGITLAQGGGQTPTKEPNAPALYAEPSIETNPTQSSETSTEPTPADNTQPTNTVPATTTPTSTPVATPSTQAPSPASTPLQTQPEPQPEGINPRTVVSMTDTPGAQEHNGHTCDYDLYGYYENITQGPVIQPNNLPCTNVGEVLQKY